MAKYVVLDAPIPIPADPVVPLEVLSISTMVFVDVGTEETNIGSPESLAIVAAVPDVVLTIIPLPFVAENEPPVPRSRQINHFRNWLKKQDHANTKRTTDTARPGTILSPL